MGSCTHCVPVVGTMYIQYKMRCWKIVMLKIRMFFGRLKCGRTFGKEKNGELNG